MTSNIIRTGPEPNPGNPGEPTPGSDNDGPEEGYTAPADLPPRPVPGISTVPEIEQSTGPACLTGDTFLACGP